MKLTRLLIAIHITISFTALAQVHPFLFTTRENIRNAKISASSNDRLSEVANELIKRAKATDLDKLPKLDFHWHQKQENIKNISLHTYHLPRPWALKAQECARASIFEPNLAYTARDILLHLSNYSFGKLPFNDGLNHARVAYPALDAYDIIYNKLSQAERTKIDAYFKGLISAVIEDHQKWVDTNPGGVPVNNHVCWHNLAIAMYGAFYDKPNMIEEAIYGSRGMEFMMNFGFRDSGLWGEASIAYHFVALEPILIMAEMLENINYPVSLYKPTDDGRDLKQAYDSFFALIFPNLDLPRVGDTYGRQPKFASGLAYEVLYRRFGDDAYAWLINQQDKRDPSALFYGKPKVHQTTDIAQSSILLPEQGYGFLRTNEGTDYWNKKGWTLMANYSDVYVHRHLDRLSIMLYGDGNHWLIDSNMSFTSGVDWDIVKTFNRHTLSHNTVMVDNKMQNDLIRRLDIAEYSSLPDVKRITMADYSCQLYPGVKQMRTCIVKEDYVLDIFQVISQSNHRYSWIYHAAAQSKDCSVKEFENKALPHAAPWKYLQDVKESTDAFTHLQETFSNDKDTFKIDLMTSNQSKLITAGYPLSNAPDTKIAANTRMISCNAKEAIFTAVYRLKDVDLPVSSKLQDGAMNNLIIELNIGDKTYRHRLPKLIWQTTTPE